VQPVLVETESDDSDTIDITAAVGSQRVSDARSRRSVAGSAFAAATDSGDSTAVASGTASLATGLHRPVDRHARKASSGGRLPGVDGPQSRVVARQARALDSPQAAPTSSGHGSRRGRRQLTVQLPSSTSRGLSDAAAEATSRLQPGAVDGGAVDSPRRVSSPALDVAVSRASASTSPTRRASPTRRLSPSVRHPQSTRSGPRTTPSAVPAPLSQSSWRQAQAQASQAQQPPSQSRGAGHHSRAAPLFTEHLPPSLLLPVPRNVASLSPRPRDVFAELLSPEAGTAPRMHAAEVPAVAVSPPPAPRTVSSPATAAPTPPRATDDRAHSSPRVTVAQVQQLSPRSARLLLSQRGYRLGPATAAAASPPATTSPRTTPSKSTPRRWR
jgi:hypothetical protein